MITEDDEIGLQGRTQCSQSPLTSIKEEPKQKLSKGYFVSTRPRYFFMICQHRSCE